MRTDRVVVVPYDESWPAEFKKIKDELLPAVGKYLTALEHVGSTSVRGLPAKPIIDLDAVIPDYGCFAAICRELSRIGYQQEGCLGIRDREAFRYSGKPHLMIHHLYVCPRNSEELKRHLLFRDYLRIHPEEARHYGKIKLEAAALFPDDIDAYLEYKSPCVREILKRAGCDEL